MNALVQHPGSTQNALVPTSMTEAIRLAEFMAKSQMLPDHLCGKPSDCLMVVMQSQRWGMDPFAVAQCTSTVHGKLCYEGKLVAAAMYATGIIAGRLQYEFSGTGQSRTVTVTGRPRGAKIDQVVTGSISAWRTSNDNWNKIPDDMLVYRGTRQWARRYAPEAMLGVYTPDEIESAPDTPEVEVTQREPEPQELPPYPGEQFDANIGKWLAVIESGRRTAEDIISMVETKGRLSDEQKSQIRGEVTEADFTEGKQEEAA